MSTTATFWMESLLNVSIFWIEFRIAYLTWLALISLLVFIRCLIIGMLLPYRFSISISMDNAHLTFIKWYLYSSLSLVTHYSLLILIIWLFSFLPVIRNFTCLAFFLVLLAYGTFIHVAAFLVSMIFRLLSVILPVICLCLCNSLIFLVALCLVVASSLQRTTYLKKCIN